MRFKIEYLCILYLFFNYMVVKIMWCYDVKVLFVLIVEFVIVGLGGFFIVWLISDVVVD